MVRGEGSTALSDTAMLLTRKSELDGVTGWNCLPFSGGASFLFFACCSGDFLLLCLGCCSGWVYIRGDFSWFAVLLLHLFCRLPMLVLIGFVPDLHLNLALFPTQCRIGAIVARPALGGRFRPHRLFLLDLSFGGWHCFRNPA